MNNKIAISMLFIFLCIYNVNSSANIVINSSRVVFDANNSEQSLLLANDGDVPVAIQTWIDDGDLNSTPETSSDSPVMTMPPIFTLEPGKQKNLRLIKTGLRVPDDRESLYWLNIYQVSPLEKKFSMNNTLIKVAVRLQMKVLYRPGKLIKNFEEYAKMLSFIKTNSYLIIKNDSPIYISFKNLKLTGTKKNINLSAPVIAPFSTKKIDGNFSEVTQLFYDILDDDGNALSNSYTFN